MRIYIILLFLIVVSCSSRKEDIIINDFSTHLKEAPSSDSLKNIKHVFKTTPYKNIKIGVAKSKSPYCKIKLVKKL